MSFCDFLFKVSDVYTKVDTGGRRKIVTLIDESQACISLKLWNADIDRIELTMPNTKVMATNLMVNEWSGKNELNARGTSYFR